MIEGVYFYVSNEDTIFGERVYDLDEIKEDMEEGEFNDFIRPIKVKGEEIKKYNGTHIIFGLWENFDRGYERNLFSGPLDSLTLEVRHIIEE